MGAWAGVGVNQAQIADRRIEAREGRRKCEPVQIVELHVTATFSPYFR